MTKPKLSDIDQKTLKVLLVDDDATALEELLEIIDLEDWAGVTANSIEKALEILEEDSEIQVVVTDVHFVDPLGKSANGIQFVSRAQARFPDRQLSYLVLSGDPKALHASVQVGAFNFLCKPFVADDLIDAINRAVSSGGGEREDAAQIHGMIKGSVEHANERNVATKTVVREA